MRHRNTEVVFNHQRGKAGAVYEDDFLVGLVGLHCGASGGGEVAGGEEHAFLHALDDQRADEVADRAFAISSINLVG